MSAEESVADTMLTYLAPLLRRSPLSAPAAGVFISDSAEASHTGNHQRDEHHLDLDMLADGPTNDFAK